MAQDAALTHLFSGHSPGLRMSRTVLPLPVSAPYICAVGHTPPGPSPGGHTPTPRDLASQEGRKGPPMLPSVLCLATMPAVPGRVTDAGSRGPTEPSPHQSTQLPWGPASDTINCCVLLRDFRDVH